MDATQNARGADFQMGLAKQQLQENLKQVDASTNSLEGAMLSQTLSNMTREVKSGMEKANTFTDRYNSPQEHNSLYLDRDCASCMTGFAPQILSHVKLACLAYVNQPIKFDSFLLRFSDVLQVKEYILHRCQGIMDDCVELVKTADSRFDALEDVKAVKNASIDTPQGSGMTVTCGLGEDSLSYGATARTEEQLKENAQAMSSLSPLARGNVDLPKVGYINVVEPENPKAIEGKTKVSATSKNKTKKAEAVSTSRAWKQGDSFEADTRAATTPKRMSTTDTRQMR